MMNRTQPPTSRPVRGDAVGLPTSTRLPHRRSGRFASLLAAAAAIAVVCPAVVSPAAADDWPTFRNGPLQQGVAAEALGASLELAWSKPTADGVTATAAIVDGQVYVGTLGGQVWCLDLATGDEVWTYETELPDDSFRPGFNAAATVAFGAVFLGDEEGVLHAIDRKTGQARWTYATDGEIDAAATPVTLDAGDSILVGSHDGRLYCLDAASGDVRWTYEVGDRISCSTAIDGDRTFLAGCDGELHVVNIQTGESVGQIPLGSPTLAAPSLRDGTLYVATQGGTVLAIDPQSPDPDATQKWLREFGGDIRSSTAVTDDIVLVGNRDKTLRALSRADGATRWEKRVRSRIDSSPVIAGELAFFGASDRTVYGVRLSDGEEVWSHKTSRGVVASPAIADGYLVIGVEGPKGALLGFRAK